VSQRYTYGAKAGDAMKIGNWKRIDWRTWTIAAFWLASIVLTLVVYAMAWLSPSINGLWLNPGTHIGAIFAGWVSGLATFTIIGAAAALVSLAQPKDDPFDERARILFRGQDGTHIDYIIARIRKLFEHYAETTTAKVRIRVHSPDASAQKNYFLLEEETIFRIKNFINDIQSTYKTDIEYTDVHAPPGHQDDNKLAYLLVDGKTYKQSQTFRELQLPLEVTIDRDSVCSIEMKAEYWIEEQDSNDFTPTRYTKELSLEFSNETTSGAIQVVFQRVGQNEELFALKSGGERKTFLLKDLPPNKLGYTFKVAPVPVLPARSMAAFSPATNAPIPPSIVVPQS
jgi:hypothetical protein